MSTDSENNSFYQVKKRSVRSVFLLTSRTILLQLINFIGYFFITIFLEVSQFGLFILVSTFIDILGYFSDIGLAAALVQKKEEPSLEEIRSTFTTQQILVLLISAILLLCSSFIKQFYQLSQEGMWLLYSFTLAFFLSSLKTIPSVLLERKLNFSKIIIPQLIEVIAFNVVVIFLAWKGFGLRSYAWAVLIRSILGVIVLYLIAPWEIGLNFSFSALKNLFKFGVPYQLNTLLAAVKDKFMILFLGRIIGNNGIALMGWAEKWSTLPLRYFLDSTVKVAFPTFSRLQANKDKLKKAIEKTLYFLITIISPALVGIALISRPFINIIPKYLKWQPAIIPLYIFCFASLWGSLAVFLTTVFNSIGKIKTTLKLMVFWTIISWIFIPILSLKFGVIGASVAVGLVNFSSIIGIFIIQKWIMIDFWGQFRGPFIGLIIMIVVNLTLQSHLPLNILGIVSIMIISALTYIFSLIIVDSKKLRQELIYLNEIIKTKV